MILLQENQPCDPKEIKANIPYLLRINQPKLIYADKGKKAGSLVTSCNPSYWEASYWWLLPITKEKSGVIWHFGVRTMDLDNV